MVIVHPTKVAMKITQHMGVAGQRVRNTDLSPQPFEFTYLLLLFESISVFPGTTFIINSLGLRYKSLAWTSLSLFFFHFDVKQGLPPKRPPKCPIGCLSRGKGLSI